MKINKCIQLATRLNTNHLCTQFKTGDNDAWFWSGCGKIIKISEHYVQLMFSNDHSSENWLNPTKQLQGILFKALLISQSRQQQQWNDWMRCESLSLFKGQKMEVSLCVVGEERKRAKGPTTDRTPESSSALWLWQKTGWDRTSDWTRRGHTSSLWFTKRTNSDSVTKFTSCEDVVLI